MSPPLRWSGASRVKDTPSDRKIRRGFCFSAASVSRDAPAERFVPQRLRWRVAANRSCFWTSSKLHDPRRPNRRRPCTDRRRPHPRRRRRHPARPRRAPEPCPRRPPPRRAGAPLRRPICSNAATPSTASTPASASSPTSASSRTKCSPCKKTSSAVTPSAWAPAQPRRQPPGPGPAHPGARQGIFRRHGRADRSAARDVQPRRRAGRSPSRAASAPAATWPRWPTWPSSSWAKATPSSPGPAPTPIPAGRRPRPMSGRAALRRVHLKPYRAASQGGPVAHQRHADQHRDPGRRPGPRPAAAAHRRRGRRHDRRGDQELAGPVRPAHPGRAAAPRPGRLRRQPPPAAGRQRDHGLARRLRQGAGRLQPPLHAAGPRHPARRPRPRHRRRRARDELRHRQSAGLPRHRRGPLRRQLPRPADRRSPPTSSAPPSPT